LLVSISFIQEYCRCR